MKKDILLAKLAKNIKRCRKCYLYKGRKHAIPGEGPSDSRVMIVGEAGGEQEDKVGRPFVGKSGQFLTQQLTAFGINRKKIFITSVVKCRAIGRPKTVSIAACLPYLHHQIAIIKPKIICLLGNVAIKALLGKGYSVAKHHGKLIRRKGITYIPMPHPAAAMRFPKYKKRIKEDFVVLKNVIG
ncbi:MAG: uracil-DNA glycosylase [Candidatus Aenigmatarchaeota archaeon]